MAKRTKLVEPEPERYAKEDEVLIASNEFVYEVDTFLLQNRSFSLEDSVFAKRKALKDGSLRAITKSKGKTLLQIYKLIAAPKQWLQEHKYTFIT